LTQKTVPFKTAPENIPEEQIPEKDRPGPVTFRKCPEDNKYAGTPDRKIKRPVIMFVENIASTCLT